MKTLIRPCTSVIVAIGLALGMGACGPKTYPMGIEGIEARGFDSAQRIEPYDNAYGGKAYIAFFGVCMPFFFEYDGKNERGEPEEGTYTLYMQLQNPDTGDKLMLIPNPTMENIRKTIEKSGNQAAIYSMQKCLR